MRRRVLCASASLLFTAGLANAQVVSINFTGREPASELAPDDQAGNPAVPGAFAKNWNNFGGASGPDAFLTDALGSLTQIRLNYNSPLGGWSLPDPSGGPNVLGGANPRMMWGYLDGNDQATTVNITGLASYFSSYQVLIYFDGDNGGSWRVGNYAIYDSADSSNTPLFADGGEDSENTNFNLSGQNPEGRFQVPVPGSGGNVAFGSGTENNDEGNFLISGSLTADSIRLEAIGGANAGGTTPRAPINGIQIIGTPALTPEPGSMALLSAAAIGLLGRRRKP